MRLPPGAIVQACTAIELSRDLQDIRVHGIKSGWEAQACVSVYDGFKGCSVHPNEYC